MQFVSLNTNDIDPPETKVWTFEARKCFWWTDEAGELNIAMKCERRNPVLGKIGNLDVGLSLAFDRFPAGSGLNYRLGSREARVLVAAPLANQRFNAFVGVATVIVKDGGKLRGSFRIWMMSMPELSLFSLFSQNTGNVQLFGTYEAVQDAKQGAIIRSFCESGGWVRPPRPPKPSTIAPIPTTQRTP